MEIYVACDICGHRYVLSSEKDGRKIKCKSCGVVFGVSHENYYDPGTSETDEETVDDEGSSISPFWGIARRVGHGLAALLTLSLLVWMGSLVVRSPREVAEQLARQRPVSCGEELKDSRSSLPTSTSSDNFGPSQVPKPKEQ